MSPEKIWLVGLEAATGKSAIAPDDRSLAAAAAKSAEFSAGSVVLAKS